MLGGEPGQGLGAEVRELVDRLPRVVQPFLELGILRLEAGDPSLARVGDLSGLLQGLQASLELDAERGIGMMPASAVRSGTRRRPQ
ncbi:hypothetical protein [Streptomyces lydicus]|uniref:hypothetical protein n=1 Tax=Streptomyces lydicus TaxID=47763 RepID=UPI0037239526